MDNKKTPKKRRKEDILDDNLFDDLPDDDFEGGSNKAWVPVLLAILLIVIIVGVFAGKKIYDKYSYSKEVMSLAEYYGESNENRAVIILGDTVLEERAILRDGNYYLPLTFVQEKLNDKFYYDVNEKILLLTTPTQIYEMQPNTQEYLISGESARADSNIWILEDEVPYIEVDFISNHADFLYMCFGEPNRIQIYTEQENKLIATVKKATQVRYRGGIKSEILEQMDKGECVYILEEMDTWSKVKTADSVIGYVENKRLDMAGEESIKLPGTYIPPVYSSLKGTEPVNLVWHQVTNSSANDGVYNLLAATKGVNTISPTWFFLNDNAGNFTSIADKGYVDNMHAQGLQVWALIDNFTNDVDVAQILASTTARKNLIQNLAQAVVENNIDGINVDFEQVPAEAGMDYVQFLRELSVWCRNNNIILSVDNYVPTEYTAHYGRAQQGEVVDYFIIMGYDEHYGGSPQAGSVASYNFVKAGIENTLKDVPASKVINAVPFYTRMWKIQDSVSSEALSMSAAENALAGYGVQAAWDEETAQNFAEFDVDGVKYQIWLEDERSLQAKLDLMSGYQLAGVAAWKLGLEKESVWDVIVNYLSGVQLTQPQEEMPAEVSETEQPDEEQTEPVAQVIETDE